MPGALLFSALLACGTSDPETVSRPDVLLVTFDTARAYTGAASVALGAESSPIARAAAGATEPIARDRASAMRVVRSA